MTSFLGRTKNFGLKLLNFDFPRWHTGMWDILKQIDAVMSIYMPGFTLSGAWENGISIAQGQLYLDTELETIWKCEVAHTAPASGSFEAYRTANPTHWSRVTNVPIYRGTWTEGVVYNSGDIVKDEYAYYLCISSNTSSVILNFPATAINTWTLIFDASDIIAAATQFDPALYALRDLSNITGPRSAVASSIGTTDLNSFRENGWVYCDVGAPNAPTNNSSYLIQGIFTANNYGYQYARVYTGDQANNAQMWKRELNNNVWSSWFRVRENEAELDSLYIRRNAAQTFTDAELTIIRGNIKQAWHSETQVASADVGGFAFAIPAWAKMVRFHAKVLHSVANQNAGFLCSINSGATIETNYRCTFSFTSDTTILTTSEQTNTYGLISVGSEVVVPTLIQGLFYPGSGTEYASGDGSSSSFSSSSGRMVKTTWAFRTATQGRRNWFNISLTSGLFKAGSIVVAEFA